MNSLYTLALRQASSLQSDLSSLEQAYASPTSTPSTTSALNGQINASLAAFDRTIEDYDSMARREIVEVKRDKAMSRVARFKEDYITLRKSYERIKASGSSAKATADRDSLFAPASASSSSISHSYTPSTSRLSRPPGATPSSPSAPSPSAFTINMSAPSFSPNSPYQHQNEYAASIHNNARTNYALRENDFMQQTGATLDAYLAQGQAVLGNLASQRDVMKGTKRRLLNAANTLGLSRETITFIERRTKADYYILLGGGAATLLCFYLILRYFG
ncbi:hypothetical protein JCM1840_007250 [Sporobolomyces johnsonii]